MVQYKVIERKNKLTGQKEVKIMESATKKCLMVMNQKNKSRAIEMMRALNYTGKRRGS